MNAEVTILSAVLTAGCLTAGGLVAQCESTSIRQAQKSDTELHYIINTGSEQQRDRFIDQKCPKRQWRVVYNSEKNGGTLDSRIDCTRK